MRSLSIFLLALFASVGTAFAFARPVAPSMPLHARQILGNIIATSAEPDCLLLQRLHETGAINTDYYDYLLRTSGRGQVMPDRISLSPTQQRRLRMHEHRRGMRFFKRFLMLR